MELNPTQKVISNTIYCSVCVYYVYWCIVAPCCKTYDAASIENWFYLYSCQLNHWVQEILFLTTTSRYVFLFLSVFVYAWIYNIKKFILRSSQKYYRKYDLHIVLFVVDLLKDLASCFMVQHLPSIIIASLYHIIKYNLYQPSCSTMWWQNLWVEI